MGVVHRTTASHYLCANADEGEAGHLQGSMDPRVRAASAARVDADRLYALQVRNAFVYIRGEFDTPYRRLAAALEEAYEAGYLGEHVLGTDFACDLVIYRGAGSYVCGEASALITSIEGKRGYPRNRPPRLTVRGLYQKPTVINNVETLSNIPWIINKVGGIQKVGRKGRNAPDFNIGHIEPGVYEIEIATVRQVHPRGLGGVLGGRDSRELFQEASRPRC
jgi:NADH-quinone oxidoreductase subunit F